MLAIGGCEKLIWFDSQLYKLLVFTKLSETFKEAKRSSLSSGRTTLRLKRFGNQQNIYLKISLLLWRTGLLSQFAPMSAERGSPFSSRRG